MSFERVNRVAVVGVGLIGGSIARDLKARGLAKHIIGVDLDSKNLSQAILEEVVDEGFSEPGEYLNDVDILVLSTPVLTLEDQVKTYSQYVGANTLVFDVGSTKEKIVKLADKNFEFGNFVGCHPMAGSEKSGVKASLVGLFVDAPCIIVRGEKTKSKFANQAKQLWEAIGSNTIELDSNEHDRYVAACSHLPHVISYTLMSSVAKRIDPEELKRVAGPSFKSYTRIAGSDARMWTDIFLDNQKNTLMKIRLFKKELEKLEGLIEGGDESKIFNYLTQTANLWKKM